MDGIFFTGIAGLAVTYGISLNVQQASVIWNICNAENKMISVERILQYSHIPSEAALIIEDSRPPNNWPETGTISFTNLQVSLKSHCFENHNIVRDNEICYCIKMSLYIAVI